MIITTLPNTLQEAQQDFSAGCTMRSDQAITNFSCPNGADNSIIYKAGEDPTLNIAATPQSLNVWRSAGLSVIPAHDNFGLPIIPLPSAGVVVGGIVLLVLFGMSRS